MEQFEINNEKEALVERIREKYSQDRKVHKWISIIIAVIGIAILLMLLIKELDATSNSYLLVLTIIVWSVLCLLSWRRGHAIAHITDAKMLLKCYDKHERINWVVCVGFLLLLVVATFLTEGWILTACLAAFVIIVFLLEWKFRGLKDRDVERLRELVEMGNGKSEANV